MPSTELPDALVAAERARAAVQDLALPHSASPHGVVAVSVGCAALVPLEGGQPDKLIEAADIQLYEAKCLRNRIAPSPASSVRR